ncbi:MAG TPA: hypothetical protein VH115_04555, partial [Solirubrobacteraceae bacterium]|nr:hypothetical protein [Solirubrobacteraceae bacterium]
SVGSTTVQHSTTYQIVNFTATLTHLPWRASLYVTNLLDRQEILSSPSQPNQLGNLTNDFLVNPPREIGVRLGYNF